MVGCILRPKCSNGKESNLYQELYKFTGEDRPLTNKYYKVASHPQFIEGVDDSLIERDSNGELTLGSFLKLADLENVDVKLLEYLNNQYPETVSFNDAVNIVKEFNRDKFYNGSFIATMSFDGGLDKVKVSFKKATPANIAESQADIERMITLNDIVNQLREYSISDSYIEGIISNNPELVGDTIYGFRVLVALAQGTSIKQFNDLDFIAAAEFAFETLKDTPIMQRFIGSLHESTYGENDAVKILAKTLRNYKWGKMNTFMSKVREFIYRVFKPFRLRREWYAAEAEQVIRGLYSPISALPKYKSYDVYTIGYESAQRSLGIVLTAIRKAASDIHNSSTKLYEGFLAQFNRKNLLSEIQLNNLNDEVCYTEICDVTAGLCDTFLETLDQAVEISNEPENLYYKADLVRSCRDMYVSLVTILQEFERATKELSKSSDPEAAHYKSQLTATMARLKNIINKDASIVAKLQNEERNITIAFFEVVLGKDCVTVSAHHYLEMHKKFLPKLKYRNKVTLTAEEIVDRYVSYESASRWVKSLSNSKDIAVAELEKFMRNIKFREERVKDNYFVKLKALTERVDKLKLNSHNMTWAMEVDSNGKITGNFVVEEWWGEFAREKNELLEALRKEFEEKVSNGEIVISNNKPEVWRDFYMSHPEYVAFMNEAFLDKDKPIHKRKVLNLAKYTNPAYWELSDAARDVLRDFINLKSEIDAHCLRDADGTSHGRRVWLPQFKKRSKVSIANSSYTSGNDVAAFAELAELDEYGSPEFLSVDSESLDIFGFENSAVDKILLYGINKTEDTLADLETNIPHAMAKYILMAIRYKTVKSTASFLSVAETVLNRRNSTLSEDEIIDSEGKMANASQSEAALSDLRTKYSGQSNQSWWYKSLSILNLASSYLLLSLNPLTSLKNVFAGSFQTVRNTIAGKAQFSFGDLMQSTAYQLLDAPFLFFNTLFNTSMHFSRTLALLEYVGGLKLSEVRLRKFNTPKLSVSNAVAFIANALMVFMSTGDHAVMAKLYRANFMSHKGFDINTGERKSIWSQLKFKDGRYLYQGMLVKKYKDIQLAVTLNTLRKYLESVITENSLIMDEEDKIDYSATALVTRNLQTLRDLGYPIDILVDGVILTDEEVLERVNEMLTPLLITEDDIFKVAYGGDKLLINDQGNYNSQDKVKVMTEEYVNVTTHFQGWMYGTVQSQLLNNVNVGIPSTVKVKKSNKHLKEDYKKHLEIFRLEEKDLSFGKFVRKYAERYIEYPMDQFIADESYHTGVFSTWLGALISFFSVKDAVRKIYNQNLLGIKGSNGEFKITPEEIMIEANKEFTEDEKQRHISNIKQFSSAKYRTYLLWNIMNPFVNKAGPTRRFLMRCGWSPDELASISFLGIALYIYNMLSSIALLFFKGNLKKYGESKPKGAMEATRATQKNIKLIEEGKLFALMTSDINGPFSEYVKQKQFEFIEKPISKYGQSNEQYINPDGTPTGEYVIIEEGSELYNEILEGIKYKYTEYDDQSLGYIIAGVSYYILQNVNRELNVKLNPYQTVLEVNKLFDAKSSSIKVLVDVINILSLASEELSDSEDTNTKAKLEKYLMDKIIFGKAGMETDKYGNISEYYEDSNGNLIRGFHYDDDGNKIINYDHEGLHFIDYYSKENKVRNAQKRGL